MISLAKAEFYAKGIECLKDPKNAEKFVESLITRRKVKFEVPGFPKKTLTIKPSDKSFRKQLKSLAKDYQPNRLSALEKKYLIAALLNEINNNHAIYKTHKAGKQKKYYAANMSMLKKKAEK